MTPDDFNRLLPLLISQYGRVADLLDQPRSKNARKVSYRAVLDDWLVTRNYAQTARAFGVTKNAAYLIVYQALRLAGDLADRDAVPQSRRRWIERLERKRDAGERGNGAQIRNSRHFREF